MKDRGLHTTCMRLLACHRRWRVTAFTTQGSLLSLAGGYEMLRHTFNTHRLMKPCTQAGQLQHQCIHALLSSYLHKHPMMLCPQPFAARVTWNIIQVRHQEITKGRKDFIHWASLNNITQAQQYAPVTFGEHREGARPIIQSLQHMEHAQNMVC